ncbi:MAG: hypothetical protein ACI9M6_001674, partial [Hydrogenophaga sp.]
MPNDNGPRERAGVRVSQRGVAPTAVTSLFFLLAFFVVG